MAAPTDLAAMQDDFHRISQLMERGILTERDTGKEYFTGYSYKTLYDWDQYFEAVVQLYLGWGTRYIQNAVTIFLDHQEGTGFIVRCIHPGLEEERSEMVKPFLAQNALLVYKHDRDLSWLTDDYYRRMQRYLEYWLTEKDEDGDGLSTWDSAPHSGMDDQIERIGAWKSYSCSGVDLNAFLARECDAFALVAELTGHPEDAPRFRDLGKAKRRLIREELWDETDGFFYDRRAGGGEPIRVKSSAAFAALWCGAATPAQTRRMVYEHLLNPAEFWRAFPVPSYAASEPGYREERAEADVGCNWRAQTWMPVNYYIMHGLMAYGYPDVARAVALRSAEVVRTVGDREYYDTDSVAGRGLDPFWGWSLLAYFMPLECDLSYDPTRIAVEPRDAFRLRVL
jgi:hypothetical protein